MKKAKAVKAKKTKSIGQKHTGPVRPEDKKMETLPAANGELEVKYVLRKEVRPDPDQPRKTFDEGKLKELAESIEAVGIRAPIQVEWVPGLEVQEPDLVSKVWRVVEKGTGKVIAEEVTKNMAVMVMNAEKRGNGFYKIVDGERRWRGAELAKVERIPVMVVDTSAPDWEKRKLAIQVVLNQQHENLTALEEAAAYGKEIESGRHTAESLYKQLGISRGTLFGRLALNKLQPAVRSALVAGKISTSVAGLVAMIPGAAAQGQFMEEVAGDEDLSEAPMSFREAQDYLEENYCRMLKATPFDQLAAYRWQMGMVADEQEAEVCASCKACPKRSGNMEGFPDAKKRPNVCTLPSCYDLKVKAFQEEVIGAAKEKGRTVLTAKQSEGVWSKWGSPGTLEYDSKYVKPEMVCEVDGKRRSYRKLAGEKVTGVWALRSDGKLEELYERAAVGKALKEAGHKFELDAPRSQVDYKQQQAEQETKRKQLEVVAEIAERELQAKVEQGKTDETFLRVVAAQVCNAYGWMQDHKLEEFEDLAKLLRKQDEKNLRLTLLSKLLAGENAVQYDGSGFREGFAFMCEAYGVDLKRVPVEKAEDKKPGGGGGAR